LNIVVQQLKGLQQNVTLLRAYRDFLRSQISMTLEEEDKCRYKANLYQKCSEIIKTWLEDSLQSNVDSISELATSGLHHVIDDQELTFKIEQEPKYNRLAMSFIIEDGGVAGDPMESFGGGAVMVVSLVMRLAVMARMKMGNLLLLDESLSSLANKYVPACASFIRRLSEQTGVNILMVTHNEEFMGHAHTAYDGEKINNLRLRQRRSVR
jgi:ABC-type molybdenum transport system ATPase subunit/photorepair protein PhrA